MARNILVIDRDDKGQFFLVVKGTSLALGNGPNQAEVVLRDLHIARIRCEIEVEGDLVVLGDSAGTPAARRELRAGEHALVGHSRLHLAAAPEPAPHAEVSPPEVGSSAKIVARQLLVIDGADQGRAFRLPLSGSITLGKSTKHADVVLHDLYVSRVHCEVQVQGEKVVVSHREGDNGTLINGARVTAPHELRAGEVLRIGNSHLRLETVLVEASASNPNAEAVKAARDDGGEEGGYAVSNGEAVSADAPSGPPDRLLALEGQVLGRYRIGHLLGRGHSGVVFRAQDLKSNLVVALKILSPEFPANGAELERFVQPLKIVPGLQHANLVSLYGAGRSGAFCWVAREYVEGESVARLIHRLEESGKFSWTRAARIAVHLGRALAFLHERRIVHNNLTPHNVLVRGSDKVTKLADLMLGKALEGSKLQEAILEKKILAELPYLAPEQVDPDTFVDHLADLYALGAILYGVLTGRPPFTGDTTEDVLTQIRETPVVRPSNYQRGIPGPFEGIVMKLLAKHQEDRYQTPGQLLADLEPLIEEYNVAV